MIPSFIASWSSLLQDHWPTGASTRYRARFRWPTGRTKPTRTAPRPTKTAFCGRSLWEAAPAADGLATLEINRLRWDSSPVGGASERRWVRRHRDSETAPTGSGPTPTGSCPDGDRFSILWEAPPSADGLGRIAVRRPLPQDQGPLARGTGRNPTALSTDSERLSRTSRPAGAPDRAPFRRRSGCRAASGEARPGRRTRRSPSCG